MATATEVESRFEEFLEKARHEPVMGEQVKRQCVVMISHEEFERLQAIEDRLWALAAEEAEKSGYIGTKESLNLLTRG